MVPYCGRLDRSIHWYYSYEVTDDGLLCKQFSEGFSYPLGEGTFRKDFSRENAYDLCIYEIVPLEFWYLDRESAAKISNASYYTYTHFNWNPMTVHFDDFAIVDIRRSVESIRFRSISYDPPYYMFFEEEAQYGLLPTPQQSKVMIPRCILGHPVNEKISLYPKDVKHLYISPGFTKVEIFADDSCELQTIYLPESLEEFSDYDGDFNYDDMFPGLDDEAVTFVVHKNSYAHRMCEQLGYNYVLAPKDEISFAEFFQWADGKLKW